MNLERVPPPWAHERVDVPEKEIALGKRALTDTPGDLQRGGFDGVDDAAHVGREHRKLSPPSQLGDSDRLMTNREPTELTAIHLQPGSLHG